MAISVREFIQKYNYYLKENDGSGSYFFWLISVKECFGLGHIDYMSYINSNVRAEMNLGGESKREIGALIDYIINTI